MFIEIRHLQLVAAVAETGSVSNAATKLHLTQSAISHQLRDLEDRAGTRLFHRGPKGLLSTAAGERLLATAREVLSHVSTAESDIVRIGSGHNTVLRIAIQCFTLYHWLPAVLVDYAVACPSIEVRIEADATIAPIEALLDGELDVAFLFAVPRDRRLVAKQMFDDELVAVVSSDHGLAKKDFVDAADFSDEHVLMCMPRRHERFILEDVFPPLGIVPRRVSYVPLSDAIVEMVKGGVGISPLPHWMVAPRVQGKEIAAVSITKPGLRRRWHAATLKSVDTQPHIAHFVELVVRHSTPWAKNAARLTVSPKVRGSSVR